MKSAGSRIRVSRSRGVDRAAFSNSTPSSYCSPASPPPFTLQKCHINLPRQPPTLSVCVLLRVSFLVYFQSLVARGSRVLYTILSYPLPYPRLCEASPPFVARCSHVNSFSRHVCDPQLTISLSHLLPLAISRLLERGYTRFPPSSRTRRLS
ncbi:hypothetical protein K402DRAFT_8100 [Aulographum hederae CBS 113979]|uniref:Uncharacterized protein n=1 Tax=Aulographum hederae CBS 113979 TaxID=1176131 RepID=A0A6G1HH07_9PEZI|nr:hypothetical protein K402DRAFT_8100 [Aulographum hederae CBS 113979]